MKPSGGTGSDSMNINGIVYNHDGQPISNVTVRSGGTIATSGQHGHYSINIQNQEESIPLSFSNGSINAGMSININEDTAMVDVFIDGFTNGVIPVKKMGTIVH